MNCKGRNKYKGNDNDIHLEDGELLKLHVLVQLDGASEASKICFSSPISEPAHACALHLHQMCSQKSVQFIVQASFGPFFIIWV